MDENQSVFKLATKRVSFVKKLKLIFSNRYLDTGFRLSIDSDLLK